MGAQASTRVQADVERKAGAKTRIASLDAFRGMVMTLMFAEVMRLPALAHAFPQSAFWGLVAFNTEHVEWQGGSLHDMIQPGFSLLVGASLPFSIASRKARGMSVGRMLAHAVWRALILIFLGIFLRSMGHSQTNFTFEDTLTQIGLGYVFLFLLGFVRVRTQVAVLLLILVGYWAAFALYPAPGPNYNYAAVGAADPTTHPYTGFMSHWNKNSNFAWAADRWFMNLFPRERPFEFNGGGYSTPSFIPTLGTMLLGLLMGEWLKSSRTTAEKLRGLVIGGAALVLVALVCQWTGICPIVKRIWTPAWTLYSGGVVVLIIAAFYALMELKGWQAWAFPLVVVGMNSIAIYVMSWTMRGFALDALRRHVPAGVFLIFGPEFETALRGAAVMLIFWGILYWMYRKKIFIKI